MGFDITFLLSKLTRKKPQQGLCLGRAKCDQFLEATKLNNFGLSDAAASEATELQHTEQTE